MRPAASLALLLVLGLPGVVAEETPVRFEAQVRLQGPLTVSGEVTAWDAVMPLGPRSSMDVSKGVVWQRYANTTAFLASEIVHVDTTYESVDLPTQVSAAQVRFEPRGGVLYAAALTEPHGAAKTTMASCAARAVGTSAAVAFSCAEGPRFEGSFYAYVVEGTALVSDPARPEAARHFEAGLERRPNPNHFGYTDEMVRSVFVRFLPDEARLETDGPLEWSAGRYEVRGELLLPAGRGRVVVGEDASEGHQPARRVAGRFEVVPIGGDAYRIRGELAPAAELVGQGRTEASAVAVSLGLVALGAWGLLLWLRTAPWVGFFTRVARDRALDHPRRAQLHELIERIPGVSTSELVEATGLGRGVVRHHARVLEVAGLVRVERHGVRSAHYLATQAAAPEAVRRARLLRRPEARSLEALVANHPGLSQRELARRVRLPRTTVARWLRDLRAGGPSGGEPR